MLACDARTLPKHRHRHRKTSQLSSCEQFEGEPVTAVSRLISAARACVLHGSQRHLFAFARLSVRRSASHTTSQNVSDVRADLTRQRRMSRIEFCFINIFKQRQPPEKIAARPKNASPAQRGPRRPDVRDAALVDGETDRHNPDRKAGPVDFFFFRGNFFDNTTTPVPDATEGRGRTRRIETERTCSC